MWYRRNDDPVFPNGAVPTANGVPYNPSVGYQTGNFTGRLNYHVNDIYAVKYDLNQKAFDVQAFFTYQNDLFTGNQNNVLPAIAPVSRFADNPWWVGANATVRPGNWTIYAQAVYKGGERKFDGTIPGVRSDTMEYEAWALELEAKYKIGPGMTAILEGYYSTGNDADNLDKSKL